jgi:hypothetical protein
MPQQLPPKLNEIRKFESKEQLLTAMNQWAQFNQKKPLLVWEAVALSGTIRQRAEQLGFNYSQLTKEWKTSYSNGKG